MIKQIKIKEGISAVLVRAIFGHLSESEQRTLDVLIKFCTNNSITITPDISKQILQAAEITQSSFNTSLHRLEKKGIINSIGKTKNLHPYLHNIDKCDGILIKIQSPESGNEL